VKEANLSLLPHQVEAIEFAKANRSGLLYLKPGTGKTLIGLELARNERTAFVVPASLCANWIVENEKFDVVKDLFWWNPAKSKSKPRTSFVCSYEAFKKISPTDLRGFTLVVCDESHKLKSSTSKRTLHMDYILAEVKPRTYFLSGTPFSASIEDAYSQYSMLDTVGSGSFTDAREFSSLSAFKNAFMFLEGHREVQTKARRTVLIPQYSGFINQTRFFELTNPYTFRKELDLNLPELSNQIIRVTADKVPPGIDMQLEEMAIALGKDVTNFQTARKLSAIAKAKVFAELLKDYHDSPIIGFSCYPDVLKIALGILEKAKYRVVFMGAQTSNVDRGVIAKKFQDGKIDILLASLLVCREGFTFTAADTIIFNDISPVASDNEQASKRIHRIGQDKPCRCIYLARSSIDARLTKLCTAKTKVTKVLDAGFSERETDEWK